MVVRFSGAGLNIHLVRRPPAVFRKPEFRSYRATGTDLNYRNNCVVEGKDGLGAAIGFESCVGGVVYNRRLKKCVGLHFRALDEQGRFYCMPNWYKPHTLQQVFTAIGDGIKDFAFKPGTRAIIVGGYNGSIDSEHLAQRLQEFFEMARIPTSRFLLQDRKGVTDLYCDLNSGKAFVHRHTRCGHSPYWGKPSPHLLQHGRYFMQQVLHRGDRLIDKR